MLAASICLKAKQFSVTVAEPAPRGTKMLNESNHTPFHSVYPFARKLCYRPYHTCRRKSQKWSWSLKIYLFIRKSELDGERKRQEIFHTLEDICNGQGWSRLKPGARTYSQSSKWSGKDQSTLSFFWCFPRPWVGTGLEVEYPGRELDWRWNT